MRQFGVSAYSFPFGCGFMQRAGRPASSAVMHAEGLIELAQQWGLSSIEIPLAPMLPDLSAATLDHLRSTLSAAHLDLVVDTAVIDVEGLRSLLPLAARAGATVVRAMLSTILEGNRADIAGGWTAHLAEMQRRIIAIRPLLEANDLVLALENHQDTTSDELIALCEAGGDHVGITLDVANPLAVAEEPLAFARKIGPWIRNVHLKDYTIWPTPLGYRLVRCTLGEGAIDFESLLSLLHEVAPSAPLHIELAALVGRHIRLFDDHWWSSFGPRDVRDVIPVLRTLAQHAQTTVDGWQTPWEREAAADDISHYERNQFEHSVRYLRTLSDSDTAAR